MVVAGQVRLVPTIGHGDWLTPALPGGGFCRREPEMCWGGGKEEEDMRRRRSHEKDGDGDGSEKDSDKLQGEREGDTRCRVWGFQSVFTHERHTTSGDTLRSRCEGEGLFFARQLIVLCHLSSALNPNTSRSESHCRRESGR